MSDFITLKEPIYPLGPISPGIAGQSAGHREIIPVNTKESHYILTNKKRQKIEKKLFFAVSKSFVSPPDDTETETDTNIRPAGILKKDKNRETLQENDGSR